MQLKGLAGDKESAGDASRLFRCNPTSGSSVQTSASG